MREGARAVKIKSRFDDRSYFHLQNIAAVDHLPNHRPEPPMIFKEERPLYLLQEVARILRAENGCPWDREQTHASLKPYLIEEAYEVYDAIEKDNPDNLKEELGDLMYQVYAHAQIASEAGRFGIDDVARLAADKLIGRHPHVFGDETAADSDTVMRNWELIKKAEKPHRESILDGVPAHLPALLKAYRVQQKVSRVGFDWDRIEGIVAKLDEELAEFKEAASLGEPDKMLEEIGDILFTIANIARFIKINPEEALAKTVDKFIGRFRFVEQEVGRSGRELEKVPLEELDDYWGQAKRRKL